MDKPLVVKDKSQPWKFVVAVGFAVLLVLILSAVKDLRPKERTLGVSGQPVAAFNLDSVGLNTSSTVTSSVSVAFAIRTHSQLLLCTNSGNADITLGATSTNLGDGNGFVFRSSSSQVFGGDNLYVGNWYGRTKSGNTSTLSCAAM